MVNKECSECGKDFKVYPYRSITSKYCSYKCSHLNLKTKVSRKCKNCGEKFKIKPSQFKYYLNAGKYCSRDCAYQGRVKENANKPIKDKYGRSNRKADKIWSKAIKKREDYTCKKCGHWNMSNHAHHINPRGRRPDLKYDINNGTVLCSPCHGWVHNNPREATEEGLLSAAKKKSEE